jgi:copper homeostasis protein CutC
MENIESLDSSLSLIVEAMKEKISQILGGSTRRDNYRKLSSSIIQEKIHHKTSSKVQTKSTSTH